MNEFEANAMTEETIPSEAAHAEEAATEPAAGTPQPPTEEKAEPSSENNGATAEAEKAYEDFSLPITFNHESRELSRDEAVKYAQLGMKLESSGLDIKSAAQAMHKLDYLAAQQGSTAEELIERLYTAQERNYREGLVERFGDDNEIIGELMRVWKDRSRDKYNRIVADRAAALQTEEDGKRKKLEERLAEEYAELKQEIPEIADFSELPAAVKKMAADGERLMSAYLLYQHRQASQLKAESQKAKLYAERSTGALGSAYADSRSAVDEAFMRGIFGR